MTRAHHHHRVTAAYDAMAVPYAEFARDELDDLPLDRAILAAFAEYVRGPVVEVGCGPGRIVAHLRDLGLEARWPIDELAGLTAETGFAEVGRMLRVPREGERFHRGHLLMRAGD